MHYALIKLSIFAFLRAIILIHTICGCTLAFATEESSNESPETYSIERNLTRALELLNLDDSKLKKTLDALRSTLKKAEIHFDALDKLFARLTIKVAVLTDDREGNEEKISTLAALYQGPTQLENISSAILAHAAKKNHQEISNLLNKHKPEHLIKAMALLKSANLISRKVATAIVDDALPINAEEVSKLFLHAAVKTKKNLLITMRTGKTYGDYYYLLDHNDIGSMSSTDLLEHEEDVSNGIDEFLDIDESSEELESDDSDAKQDYKILKHIKAHARALQSMSRTYRAQVALLQGTGYLESRLITDTYVDPHYMSGYLLSDYYFSPTNLLEKTGQAFSFWSSEYLKSSPVSWWLYYTNGYLEAGKTCTVTQASRNFASTPGEISMIKAGIFLESLLTGLPLVAGFRLPSGNQHEVMATGSYPIDGPLAPIRGLEGIRIRDYERIGFSVPLIGTFYKYKEPLDIAFKGNVNFTKDRIYKTYVSKEKITAILKEGNKPALFYLLGAQIKNTKSVSFENPEELNIGDELMEVKVGELNGGFVVGLDAMQNILPLPIGAGASVKGEFALGIRRFSTSKFEVSIETRQVYELSLFGNVLNLLGAGNISAVSLAKKQAFLFDFNNQQAKIAFYKMVRDGLLPTPEHIFVSHRGIGPSNVLTNFQMQNKHLSKMGTARTLLEETRITVNKIYAGFNSPLIPASFNLINTFYNKLFRAHSRLHLVFSGVQREFLLSLTKEIVTDGLYATKRDVYTQNQSEGRGFSGKTTENVQVTHTRIYSNSSKTSEEELHSWRFGGLFVQAYFDDTVIYGQEELLLIKKLNELFGAQIGIPSKTNSRYERSVTISRTFAKEDLEALEKVTNNQIDIASQISGINAMILQSVLSKIRGRTADEKASVLKHFIKSADGAKGFAAVHYLLGADTLKLGIHSDSAYLATVQAARTFMTKYLRCDDKGDGTCLLLLPTTDTLFNRLKIRKFYDDARIHLGGIDRAMRFLGDDQFLVDDTSKIANIHGSDVVNQLVKQGLRQSKKPLLLLLASTRQRLLQVMDLEYQGFTVNEHMAIMHMAAAKRVRLADLAWRLQTLYRNQPLHPTMNARDVSDRIGHVMALQKKVDKRLKLVAEDQEMTTLDPDYMKAVLDSLTSMKSDLHALISVQHLKEPDLYTLLDMLTTWQKTSRARISVSHHYVHKFLQANQYGNI